MKFLIDNWYIILAALGSGTLLLLPQLQAGNGGISAAEAVNLINRNKALLVDVSETNEYAQLHCSGAVNLPFGQVEDKLETLAKSKTRSVVLVCPSGSRAAKMASLLKKKGFEQVVSLQGGTKAWQDANYPIVKSAA